MTREALSRMIAALEAEPDVALVGPRLVDESGELMHSVRRYPTIRSMWARALFLHRLWPRAPWANEIEARTEAYERPAYPEWVSGACMLVRRDAFDAVQGFDDRFFMYCEDQDKFRPGRAPPAVVSAMSLPPSSRTVAGTRRRARACTRRSPRAVEVISRQAQRPAATPLQHAAIVTEALTHALAGLAGLARAPRPIPPRRTREPAAAGRRPAGAVAGAAAARGARSPSGRAPPPGTPRAARAGRRGPAAPTTARCTIVGAPVQRPIHRPGDRDSAAQDTVAARTSC